MEYYSVSKKKEIMQYVLMNLRKCANWNKPRKISTAWFHLYEVSKIVKFQKIKGGNHYYQKLEGEGNEELLINRENISS